MRRSISGGGGSEASVAEVRAAMVWCDRCSALHETGVFLANIPLFTCPLLREDEGIVLVQVQGQRSDVSREVEA